MMEGWLMDAVDEFWDSVGEIPSFPRNLEPLIPLGFPISYVPLPDLTVFAVEDWLHQQGGDHRMLCQDRQLSGCLAALRGRAFLFYDAGGPADLIRFVMAHEVSHFLLDYLRPRRRAIKLLGPQIIEVLDDDRPPTVQERVDAALRKAPVGTYYNLLPRDGDGGIPMGAILRAEERADRLALELLAPQDDVPGSLREQGSLSLPHRVLERALVDTFGLPPSVARRYATFLERRAGQESNFSWLAGI